MYSPELKTQYSFIGIENIGKSVDTLSQFHYDIPAVSDYPCGNVKETISQSFDKLFLVHAGQSQPLDPVYDVIGQHPNAQICPVCMELLTGKSVQRESVFCFLYKILHS